MKVFVGYDIREDIAYQVCEYSIKKHQPKAEVIPLKQKELRQSGIYTREVDPLSSTEFTFTRFLVPYLTDYKGWAVFIDCDFVLIEDIKNLFEHANDDYAVKVVKHDYTPKEGFKMDGCKQLPYPKNKQLTPDVNNSQTGQFLHRFQWLDDTEIGTLSPSWNWLAGWYKEPNDGVPCAIHYTEGGPWFQEYRRCEYHKIWKKYLKEMLK